MGCRMDICKISKFSDWNCGSNHKIILILRMVSKEGIEGMMETMLKLEISYNI